MQVLKALLTTPLMWVWYLLLVAVILLRRTRQEDRKLRIGWYSLVVGLLLLAMFSLQPFADALTRPLLRQYSLPSADTLNTLEAITVLGGGSQAGIPSDATYKRIMAGIELFQQSKAEFMVVQGATEVEGEPTDGEIMQKITIEAGTPRDKIILDSISRNTAEHPIQLQKLLPQDIKRIGIVTSAIHMPRAMETFQRYMVDKQFVALPVETADKRIHYRLVDAVPSVGALSNSSVAFHEWIGLLWYRVSR